MRVWKAPGSQKTSKNSARPRFLTSGVECSDEKLDVFFPPVAVFRRDVVGAHEGWDDVHGVEGGEVAQDLELFDLVLEVEAVAALGLDGRRARQEHPVEAAEAKGEEVVQAGRARRLDRRLNAHAPFGQLPVGQTLDPQTEFPGPVPGEGEMGVGVDETGQGDQAPSVDRDGTRLGRDLGQEFVFGPDEDDDAFRRCDPAVLDDAEVPQCPSVLELLLRGGGLARTHGNNDSMSVVTGSAITPGVIAAIQTFGDRINLHMHLHFLVTEGGVDEAGVFHTKPGRK